MTNVQLYLSIGIPTLAVLVGILINMMMFNAQGHRINDMGRRIDDMGQRVSDLNTSLSARIDSLETRLNQVIGYLMEHR